MIVNLLSGDTLTDTVREAGIPGELIVFNECLSDGPVQFETLEEFWDGRAAYLEKEFGENPRSYVLKVVAELKRFEFLNATDELVLWFGDDLFCQVNMWFSSTLFSNEGMRVSRVFPKGFDFGHESEAELQAAFESRAELHPSDVDLCVSLWLAFSSGDNYTLTELGKSRSPAFRRLEQCCLAAAERETRPQELIDRLNGEFDGDFGKIFKEFCRLEPIYGYGDAQVLRRLKKEG
ncbi:MAG TPA: hypothetical protein PKO33_01200 [Pyrinomonadaceae bacterium]|nr:hypothetical protein [Pyrinomonadaceae bacterium]